MYAIIQLRLLVLPNLIYISNSHHYVMWHVTCNTRFDHLNNTVSSILNRPNAIIPTTPEPPPSSEPTSPSSSASSPNIRNESPAGHTSPEWNGDRTPSQTPSRDNSGQNTPRNTPTQQQNRNQQQNMRNVPPASSLRERRAVRGSDEQNGNQSANGRVERGLNSGQPRRPNRSNRNRNNVMPSSDRRTDPPQPPDLPRGYGKKKSEIII